MTEEIEFLRKNFLTFCETKQTHVFRSDDDGYRMVSKNNNCLKSIYMVRNLNTQKNFKFTVYFGIILKTTVIE